MRKRHLILYVVSVCAMGEVAGASPLTVSGYYTGSNGAAGIGSSTYQGGQPIYYGYNGTDGLDASAVGTNYNFVSLNATGGIGGSIVGTDATPTSSNDWFLGGAGGNGINVSGGYTTTGITANFISGSFSGGSGGTASGTAYALGTGGSTGAFLGDVSAVVTGGMFSAGLYPTINGNSRYRFLLTRRGVSDHQQCRDGDGQHGHY